MHRLGYTDKTKNARAAVRLTNQKSAPKKKNKSTRRLHSETFNANVYRRRPTAKMHQKRETQGRYREGQKKTKKGGKGELRNRERRELNFYYHSPTLRGFCYTVFCIFIYLIHPS